MAMDGRTDVSEETVFIQHYAEQLREEADRILALLPVIEDIQWERSPRTERAVETADRKASSAPSDPVGDAVVDPVRLEVRKQAKRSEQVMKDALIKAQGTRVGFERSLARWEPKWAVGASND